MRPNIDNKKQLLIECECRNNHWLEVYIDEDGDLWMSLIDRPNSICEVLRWWWTQRKVWWSEIDLSDTDIEALRDKLTEYLEKKK